MQAEKDGALSAAAAAVEPATYCSPRHQMLSNLRNEVPNAVDNVASMSGSPWATEKQGAVIASAVADAREARERLKEAHKSTDQGLAKIGPLNRLPATSSTRVLNLRSLCCVASYDVASNIWLAKIGPGNNSPPRRRHAFGILVS